MAQPGAGFSMTPEDMKKAELEFIDRATNARTQFNKLESAVAGGASKGEAFVAANQTAQTLRKEGEKLERLITELAENISRSAQEYGHTSTLGTDAMRKVESMATGGPTLNRLVPGNQ